MNDKTLKIGRLAMRHEGKYWNAYYAPPDSMVGAIRIGGVIIALMRTEERRKQFLDCMREIVGDMIEEVSGHRPTWPEGVQPAPESERAGNA